jgi:LemA protein
MNEDFRKSADSVAIESENVPTSDSVAPENGNVSVSTLWRRNRAIIIVVGILMLIVGSARYGITQYNALQHTDAIVDEAWGQVLNQYVRRADLVPSLVTVVNSYAKYESGLFTEIAAARSRVLAVAKTAENGRNPETLAQLQETQNQLATSLSKLLLLAENYPEIKANEVFRDLMVSLEGSENRISYARQRYILAVADYNLGLRIFPVNLIAARAGFKARPQFKVEDETKISHMPRIDLQ